MKSNKIHLLIILTLIFAIVGATMAAYIIEFDGNEYRTNVKLTIAKNFSCSADGGGNITSGEVQLMPTTCTDDGYTGDTPRVIRREITVTNTLDEEGLTIHTNLWLNVDSIDEGLSQSRNLKYALTTSSTSCTDGVIYTGTFNDLKEGDKVKLLGQKYSTEEPQKYYLYIWMDKAETNPDILNQNFELSLGGECSDITSADLSYSVSTVDGTSTFAVGSGYYELESYTCEKDTTEISYDPITKKITSNDVDKCNLNLTTKETTLYDVVEIGDYIAYSGDTNNGCTGKQCNGWNAKQTGTDLYEQYGGCSTGTQYRFTTYGWRVLYKEDNFVYIVSAGAPECVTGTTNNNTQTISDLDAAALKYCNELYQSNGECNYDTAHPFNDSDFYKFTSQYYGTSNARHLSSDYGSNYCYAKYGNQYCGYNNDIIDNGSYYWFGSKYSSTNTTSTLFWLPFRRYVYYTSNATNYGLRPVLKLDSSIQATGGTGTMKDPYLISERSEM